MAGPIRKRIPFWKLKNLKKKRRKNQKATKLEGGGVRPQWSGHTHKKLRLPIVNTIPPGYLSFSYY